MTDQITNQLAEALREAVRALNVHPRFKVQETNSYAIASQCDKALRAYDRHRNRLWKSRIAAFLSRGISAR